MGDRVNRSVVICLCNVAVLLSFIVLTVGYGSARAAQLPQAGPPVSPTAALHPCLDAIAWAEQRYATPAGLLTAIATVETGRKDARTGEVNPWPWSVNAENTSYYFSTRTEAVTWVRDAQARGTTSIDVGCMQVNLLYHPQAFASVEEAFDPMRNADYAARFLVQLCARSGSWEQATGFYHSRTSDLATDYRRHVASVFTQPVATLQNILAPSLQSLQKAWQATRLDATNLSHRVDKPARVVADPPAPPARMTTTLSPLAKLSNDSLKVLDSTSGNGDGRLGDLSLHSEPCWKTRADRGPEQNWGQVVAGG